MGKCWGRYGKVCWGVGVVRESVGRVSREVENPQKRETLIASD